MKSEYKIGILGPESCGKSTLTQQLAEHYSGTAVPEYARFYMEQLLENQPIRENFEKTEKEINYTFEDVVKIARKQIEQIVAEYRSKYVFFDTELIITKVWFLDKYGIIPDFFAEALRNNPIDFYLLLAPDLPFETDPVRENPMRREELFNWYKKELKNYGFQYKIIDGIGDFRLQKAVASIDSFIHSNH